MNALAKVLGIATAGVLLSEAPATAGGGWSAPADAVVAWEAADPALTERFFSPGKRYAVPHAGITGGNAVAYASVGRFVDVVGSVPRGSTVMYDPEPWGVTPRWEQTHPRRSMRRFVRVAREHDLRAVLAPSRTLAGPDPQCDRFLRCGYLEIPADGFQLQSQKLQCDLEAFRPFVKEADARAASPLIVQLTVIWEDPCVTPKVVRDAWSAARPWADSYALWARPGDPQGLEALRLIAAAQG
jgi:hypothetical protein